MLFSWRVFVILGTGTALGLWFSLPEEKKARLAQKAYALKYRIADLKEDTYLKTKMLTAKRKNGSMFLEGLGLVVSEYGKMAYLNASSLLEEIRIRLLRATREGQEAYNRKKKELEDLSRSFMS